MQCVIKLVCSNFKTTDTIKQNGDIKKNQSISRYY